MEGSWTASQRYASLCSFERSALQFTATLNWHQNVDQFIRFPSKVGRWIFWELHSFGSQLVDGVVRVAKDSLSLVDGRQIKVLKQFSSYLKGCSDSTVELLISLRTSRYAALMRASEAECSFSGSALILSWRASMSIHPPELDEPVSM